MLSAFLRPSSSSVRILPAMKHLWFQQALAMPGLGPRLLSDGQQRLPRYLFSAASPASLSSRGGRRLHCPAAGTGTRPRGLCALSASGAAGISAHHPRQLPEDSTAYAYLAALWRSGLRFPPALTNHLLRSHQAYADHVVAFVPGASHFIADEKPDVVVDRALQVLRRAGASG